MNIYLAWTITILYGIAWPIYWILRIIFIALAYLVRPLYGVLWFLAQPFIYFGLITGFCITWPFRLLARLETLYIYLGIAGLVGIAFGLGLHFLYGLLHSTLRLGSKPRVWGPTAKEHRAAWRKKKAAKEANESLMYSPSTAMDDISPKRRRGLLSQTIHEEIDSDF